MVTPVTVAQGVQALAQNASGLAQGLSNAVGGAQSALGRLAIGSFWDHCASCTITRRESKLDPMNWIKTELAMPLHG